MAKSLKIKSFLRHLSPEILRAYFDLQGVQILLPDKKISSDQAEAIELEINTLDDKVQQKIETDFQDIQELASEGGWEAILEVAELKGTTEEILYTSEQFSFYDKALYCLINYSEVFEDASVLFYVTELPYKSTRIGLKSVSDLQSLEDRKEGLSESIRHYLKAKEGRGKNCHIDVYKYSDRICFIAHPESYPQSDTAYKGSELVREVRKPSFQIAFSYYPEDGRLELSVRGGKKKIQDIFNIFNEKILLDPNPVPEDQKLYDLDKFLSPDFVLTTEPEDEIEVLFVKQLRFSSKFNIKNRFTIEIDSGEGMTHMAQEMKYRNIKPGKFRVTQATVKFKFPGKKNKGSVTMILTHPDRDNLKDSPYHLKAKKYIEKWGLIHEDITEETI